MIDPTIGFHRVIFFLCGLLILGACRSSGEHEKRVLVFSKTVGFRHASIPDGQAMFLRLGAAHRVRIDTTEEAIVFHDDSLRHYHAVVFLSTTGDVLDHAQQQALRRYVEAGGGFMGIHGASGAEYTWPWYGQLVGARFESHPAELQESEIYLTDQAHPATRNLPLPWVHTEEWYNFRSVSPDIRVLATVNESLYEGGKHGDHHPVAWYQELEAGRSFYTALGHRPETYYDTTFVQHVWGGLSYVMGDNALPDYRRAVTPPPTDETHLIRNVLLDSSDVSEPMELAVAPDGRVFYAERRGAIRVYEPATGQARLVGRIPVYEEHEDGLLGITLDLNFPENKALYVCYSAPGEAFRYHVSRFTLDATGSLDAASERILLTIPQEHSESNHTGGSLAFGPAGNLFISMGDNTNPFGNAQGYAPIDERPGRTDFDAQRSSGNTQDLRGKILRLRPIWDTTEQSLSYTIPEGNLFAADGSEGRPEIYAMGMRNPFRISIDPKTGWLYWGDVGPDAGVDSIQGPRGYDEINQARTAGNYGWPYFVADNQAYADVDFVTGVAGEKFDPAAPRNASPRNTGAAVLPSARPAFIFYPYVASDRFPEMGEGARSAMAGPVYHYDPTLPSAIKLPKYYDEGVFIYDWMRNRINVVRLDERGHYAGMEPFMRATDFNKIIDMELGPDGALYILEYGTNWYAPNSNARLSRLEYHQNPIPASPPSSEPQDVVVASGHTSSSVGNTLVAQSDCKACHATDQASVGPSFAQIAARYEADSTTVNQLAKKIITGGGGVWGQTMMSSHPQLTVSEAKEMVYYILSLE